MKPLCVLVTGANGFVGTALVHRLVQEPEVRVIAAGRHVFRCAEGAQNVVLNDLADGAFDAAQFEGVDVVVHAAARVHVLRDRCSDPLQEYRRVNVAGTLSLARAAAKAGVRRFIFLSSIKVNGEATRMGAPFTADTPPSPQDAYGLSKHEAEVSLQMLASETGLDVVIVRPPLVYGPQARGNFQVLMRWLLRGIPMPLKGIENRRSLVSVFNLVDLLVLCLRHPAATNRVLLVSDGADLSTPDLLNRLGEALGRPARLVSLPRALLRALLWVIGQRPNWQRLCGSLQVDMDQTCRLLNWQPPISIEKALHITAQQFRARS